MVHCCRALGVYGFSFPLLLTTCHMAFSFCVLLPFMLREPFRSKHAATLQKQWKGLLAIGIYMAANISLNNLSLVLITLSLNQVIRYFAIQHSSQNKFLPHLDVSSSIISHLQVRHSSLHGDTSRRHRTAHTFTRRGCGVGCVDCWCYGGCLGRLSFRQCDWPLSVLHWHSLQCSHDVHNWQSHVREARCAAIGVLYCACILCHTAAPVLHQRGNHHVKL